MNGEVKQAGEHVMFKSILDAFLRLMLRRERRKALAALKKLICVSKCESHVCRREDFDSGSCVVLDLIKSSARL